MQNNLNIRGEPIQAVYSAYRKGQYIVNRRYQRKLVWAKVEKQRFIDSILSEFPVPLFLGVSFFDAKKGSCFEILDGMQRLEAITSFIEGRFAVDGRYFDLSVISETNSLKEQGELHQRQPVLSKDLCTKLLNYPLPISTTTYTNSEGVDEAFRRINTGGVRLSRHEVRQAGALGEFPQLVRKCSTYIRGDTSHNDIVDLQAMHEISLTNNDLDYGIKVRDTFWNSFHVMPLDNVMASRDEELVAHMLLRIVLGEKSQTSSKFLDLVYATGTDESTVANDGVVKFGFEYLYKSFCMTYDTLKDVFSKGDRNLAVHLYDGDAKKIGQAYQVIFLSTYDFLVKNNKTIKSHEELNGALKGIATSCMPILFKDAKWLNRHREQLVKSVSGVIGSCFIDSGNEDSSLFSWMESFDTILNQSRTENVNYDFKSGIFSISKDADKGNNIVEKIVKTLCAMHNSNLGPSYILLGVADKKSTADHHKKIYGGHAVKNVPFYIVGVDAEAKKVCGDLDRYQQFFRQKIDECSIDEATKRNITRNTIFLSYYEKDVAIVKIDRTEKPIAYAGEYYVRKMADVDPVPVPQDSLFEFFTEFKNQSSQYPYMQ